MDGDFELGDDNAATGELRELVTRWRVVHFCLTFAHPLLVVADGWPPPLSIPGKPPAHGSVLEGRDGWDASVGIDA